MHLSNVLTNMQFACDSCHHTLLLQGLTKHLMDHQGDDIYKQNFILTCEYVKHNERVIADGDKYANF